MCLLIKGYKWGPIFKSLNKCGTLKQCSISLSTSSSNHYDIIIAGGGMVGTTLACTLGKNSKLSNKRILLLEGSQQKQFKLEQKYSNRVSSLNPGTIKLLKDINVWKYIENARFCAVKKMQVWDGISNAMITFDNDDYDDISKSVAYIVENDVLLGAVGEEVKTCSNVEVAYQAKIKDYHLPEFDENYTEISLADGAKYTCNLLLGCDGANSQVRKAMQVEYLNWSYNQMGVVATLKLEEEFDNTTAWQRFLPDGVVALLPLTKNLSSLVWSTSPQHAKELINLPENDFVDKLNESLFKSNTSNSIVDEATKGFDNILRILNCPTGATRQLPPKIVGCEDNSRAGFPLGFGHATNYIRKGVALVGDAAHRVHPLAGQGVNLGFGDITCLNEILGEASYAGSKLENLQYLKEYETERQKHNVPTMLAVEGLFRLYKTDFTPVVVLRSLGLQATHAMGSLKRAIITQASV